MNLVVLAELPRTLRVSPHFLMSIVCPHIPRMGVFSLCVTTSPVFVFGLTGKPARFTRELVLELCLNKNSNLSLHEFHSFG